MKLGEAMIQKHLRGMATVLTSACLVMGSMTDAFADRRSEADNYDTKTPIKHVVVIFQENVSFDHYFATYPHATNPKGEPRFENRKDTPRANNLLSSGLLDDNPNSSQPFRLDLTQAVTCDQDHNYADEQKAHNHGLMDKFPESVGAGGPGCQDYGHGKGLVMGYYDGNTVTALWNYAQHFAMSDNSFSTTFGPSTPGALNLIAGNTAGATVVSGSPAGNLADGLTSGAVIGDPRPAGDDCGPTGKTYITINNRNVGDLLNDRGLTWGWFQGGFAPTAVTAGVATCAAASTGLAGATGDYIAHHEPFQYFPQTQNLHHVRPSDPKKIGKTDQANHQYDLTDFWTVLDEGRLPAVSYLKAKGAQDGHAAYSDPVDEQLFLVQTINRLQRSPEWKDMAIVIAYDDSDGWYDHAMDPVINQSDVSDDNLTGPGACGVTVAGATPGRCGFGPRQPLLVISPFAKQNYIDHRITDQSSILRFIEDNWGLGRLGNGSTDVKAGTLNGLFDFSNPHHAKVLLDPQTGLELHN
jgi:phospholipase C